MEEKLKQMQEKCDKLYAKDGLTDEVLDKQIEINKLRHKHDISDKKNQVYKEFVQ